MLVAVATLVTAAATALPAQRPVVRGNDVWIGATGDVRIAPRALLTVTTEERRSNGIQVPRQLFGLVGLLGDIGNGVRAGAGYSGWHTSPNPDFGPGRPTREHRAWQQLSGSHRTLGAMWNHRLRYEQRWISPEPVANAERDWSYTSRVRHQIRVVAPVDGRAPAATRLYLMPNVEAFVRTTAHSGTFFDQTRLGTAIGVGVLPRLNLEAGYMRQSILRGDGAHELHHVVQITGRLLTARRPSG